ncbi:VOC family protein [Cryptosporangium japonicum]|uniref:Catechol 2,3-dioxygenase n=1 Tax=Cryptosporangium japonicum TaxID=80872 RepID=A0ABP3ESK1_9ACTN
MFTERIRDVAHVGSVELFTPLPDESRAFFVDLMGMSETGRRGDSVYLHAWDDYERFTIKLTARDRAGIGRTYLRAAGPEALRRRAAELPGRWVSDELGLGPVYLTQDPDGHDLGLYWETERFTPATPPALKNQADRFPGRGANVRRLDHVNYLAADTPACGRFLADGLKARPTEQIVGDDGVATAIWYTVSDKSYDLVYTDDRTGSNGRLHHIALATDTRDDILRAADVCLDNGVHIETGPHKHAIQQTFFLYVYEPGGNRVELCNAGARLVLAPDWELISWTPAERAKGQAWGLKTIESFHTHGTPPVG